jgi:hypothetical protein
MITGEEFCKKAFDKSKSADYDSFKKGWYARETFSYSDSRRQSEIVEEINAKLQQVREYIRELYLDFSIDDTDKYMGHNDPFANCNCLLNHVRADVKEIADRRAGEQYLLF